MKRECEWYLKTGSSTNSKLVVVVTGTCWKNAGDHSWL